MKISIIAGARPNFIKIAPIIHAIENAQGAIKYRLVHTGQHYDEKLSGSFFTDLNIPPPDINLSVGSGTQAEQTAKVMIEFEKELTENPCDFVLVVGDVNSTLACSIVAKKQHTKVIHVEAGLRSWDEGMPEEINRRVVDSISDLFFTTTKDASTQLIKEGVDYEKIHFVGNVMIDSLIANLDRLQKPSLYDQLNLSKGSYYLMTLHRPSNVDEMSKLSDLIILLGQQAEEKQVIFPVHPRTKKTLESIKIPSNIKMIEPLRYLEFMYLIKNAFAVLTDSGGIQEETTYLGIPCLTLRENTERPETITLGTNRLLGTSPEKIKESFTELKTGEWKKGQIPVFWDGGSADRIINSILRLVS